jgi:hypothetical protein
MATDTYHLYYIGKSYHDNIPTDKLPFKDEHNLELARRGLFFFKKFLDVRHDFSNTGAAKFIDEMGYTACLWITRLHEILGDRQQMYRWLVNAQMFCPLRSEHLKRLAWMYQADGDMRSFLETTTKMLERNNPFPGHTLFIEDDAYPDTGTLVADLHNEAIS